jgi:hypothetical protein
MGAQHRCKGAQNQNRFVNNRTIFICGIFHRQIVRAAVVSQRDTPQTRECDNESSRPDSHFLAQRSG